MSPASYPNATAGARSRALSFVEMWHTCVFTATSLTYRRSPFSAFVRPFPHEAEDLELAVAEELGVALELPVGGVLGDEALMMPRVSLGARSDWPAATTRIASAPSSLGILFVVPLDVAGVVAGFIDGNPHASRRG